MDGVLVNPSLPELFDNTANELRPAAHQKFWNVPFIVTETVADLDAYYAGRTDPYAEEGRQHWIEGRVTWLKAWPTGVRYDVRCLDDGAWDRSSAWGAFATQEEAIACAKTGPQHRQSASV